MPENKLNIGANVAGTISADGKTLTLTIDLETNLGRSSTGKMMAIANTGGFQGVPGTDLRINVYCGRRS